MVRGCPFETTAKDPAPSFCFYFSDTPTPPPKVVVVVAVSVCPDTSGFNGVKSRGWKRKILGKNGNKKNLENMMAPYCRVGTRDRV